MGRVLEATPPRAGCHLLGWVQRQQTPCHTLPHHVPSSALARLWSVETESRQHACVSGPSGQPCRRAAQPQRSTSARWPAGSSLQAPLAGRLHSWYVRHFPVSLQTHCKHLGLHNLLNHFLITGHLDEPQFLTLTNDPVMSADLGCIALGPALETPLGVFFRFQMATKGIC